MSFNDYEETDFRKYTYNMNSWNKFYKFISLERDNVAEIQRVERETGFENYSTQGVLSQLQHQINECDFIIEALEDIHYYLKANYTSEQHVKADNFSSIVYVTPIVNGFLQEQLDTTDMFNHIKEELSQDCYNANCNDEWKLLYKWNIISKERLCRHLDLEITSILEEFQEEVKDVFVKYKNIFEQKAKTEKKRR